MSPKLLMNSTQAWDVFQLINQGVTIFDDDLKLVFWNDRFLDLLEFPKELAFEGAEFASFMRHNAELGEYGDGDVDRLVSERVDIARRFESHRLERFRPDGTVIEVSGSPLPNGGFVSIYTDITIQKKRELELEQQASERTRELANSQARLQLIANEVPAGIAQVDSDMTILFANRKFARAYGHTPQSIVGLNCDDVLHPQTLAESKRFFQAARRGKVVDFEMTVRMPKDRIRDVRTYLRPESRQDEQVSSFYMVSVDITRNKAATKALLSAQKMDALGRLSSGISHDFNNLLTIILGNLVPLEDKIEDDNIRDEFLVPAISAARRGSSLTERLINLARQKPINPKTANADKSLSDVVDLLRRSIPGNIDFAVNLDAADTFVRVDASELETAILNIVVNARDAIVGAGKIDLTSEVVILSDEEAVVQRVAAGEYLKITLADTGVGMSAEETEQVFEPFHTTKADIGGSGLGLAMVYSFVRQSNGAIWVESEVGVGSRFTIILPTTEAIAQSRTVKQEIHAAKSDEEGKPLVMLVEDDFDVRKVVRRQLNDIGFSTLEADNAATAMELLEIVEEITAVVSDVIMPGEMNGIDLMCAIRQQYPKLKVVLMSGNQDESEHLLKTKKKTPLLRKPFSTSDLSIALLGAAKTRAGRSATAE